MTASVVKTIRWLRSRKPGLIAITFEVDEQTFNKMHGKAKAERYSGATMAYVEGTISAAFKDCVPAPADAQANEKAGSETDGTRLRHDLTSHDAVRLLCGAVQALHHVEVEQEGLTPPCKDAGEFMLQDALQYLAFGNVQGVYSLLKDYEEWLKTGVAPWPYDGGPPPGYEMEDKGEGEN